MRVSVTMTVGSLELRKVLPIARFKMARRDSRFGRRGDCDMAGLGKATGFQDMTVPRSGNVLQMV